MSNFICKKCGSNEYEIKDKPNGTGIAHGLYCAKCGFWHKWIGKNELSQYDKKDNKDDIIALLQAENAALRERLENAIEVHFVFNKKVFVMVYDKEGNPYLFEGIVTGIGTDTNKLYEGEIDLLMSVVNECGETQFINGKQYRKEWFCEDEIEYAEARLAELKRGKDV